MHSRQYLKPRGERMIRPSGRLILELKRFADQGFVYVICEGKNSNGPVKIGWSLDPMKRLGILQTGNPYQLELAHVLPGDRLLESAIHAALRDERMVGEWFQGESTRKMVESFASTADAAASRIRAHSAFPDENELPGADFIYGRLDLTMPGEPTVRDLILAMPLPEPEPPWEPDPNYIIVGETAGPPPTRGGASMKSRRTGFRGSMK